MAEALVHGPDRTSGPVYWPSDRAVHPRSGPHARRLAKTSDRPQLDPRRQVGVFRCVHRRLAVAIAHEPQRAPEPILLDRLSEPVRSRRVLVGRTERGCTEIVVGVYLSGRQASAPCGDTSDCPERLGRVASVDRRRLRGHVCAGAEPLRRLELIVQSGWSQNPAAAAAVRIEVEALCRGLRLDHRIVYKWARLILG